MLNGKNNLARIWGQCIGCPTGPDATARDIVEYIAHGQIKTLACYDALPSLSNSQIEKQAVPPFKKRWSSLASGYRPSPSAQNGGGSKIVRSKSGSIAPCSR